MFWSNQKKYVVTIASIFVEFSPRWSLKEFNSHYVEFNFPLDIPSPRIWGRVPFPVISNGQSVVLFQDEAGVAWGTRAVRFFLSCCLSLLANPFRVKWRPELSGGKAEEKLVPSSPETFCEFPYNTLASVWSTRVQSWSCRSLLWSPGKDRTSTWRLGF